MAFAVIDNFTIPVEIGGARQQPRLIADTEPTVDGTLRRQRTGVKRSWPITTRAMTRAQANILYSILTGPGPHSFTGDLPGAAATVLAEVQDFVPVKSAQGDYAAISFRLDEV